MWYLSTIHSKMVTDLHFTCFKVIQKEAANTFIMHTFYLSQQDLHIYRVECDRGKIPKSLATKQGITSLSGSSSFNRLATSSRFGTFRALPVQHPRVSWTNLVQLLLCYLDVFRSVVLTRWTIFSDGRMSILFCTKHRSSLPTIFGIPFFVYFRCRSFR